MDPDVEPGLRAGHLGLEQQQSWLGTPQFTVVRRTDLFVKRHRREHGAWAK